MFQFPFMKNVKNIFSFAIMVVMVFGLMVFFEKDAQMVYGQDFDPTSISGLSLWLNAGTITGFDDGDLVDSWLDQSGQTIPNNVTQGTASKQPTFQTNEVNGYPAVRFDGNDDNMDLSSKISTARTLFVVIRFDGDQGDYSSIWGRSSAYHGDGSLFKAQYIFDNKYLEGTYAHPGYIGGEWYENEIIIDPITTTIKKNNWVVLSVVTSADVAFDLLASDRDVVNRFINADIAEMLVYDNAVSDIDRQGIEQYLLDKYAECTATCFTPYEQTFAATYGGIYDDVASTIQQTSDGGYIVGGYYGMSSDTDRDMWLLKFQSNGEIAWQKQYGGTGSNIMTSIHQLDGGGYFVVGENGVKPWLLRLESEGQINWQKTYGRPDEHIVNPGSSVTKTDIVDLVGSTHKTSDNGLVMKGLIKTMILTLDSGGTSISFQDYTCIRKFDMDGEIEWEKIYEEEDFYGDIMQVSDGGYIMGANTDPSGTGNIDILMLKLDSMGVIEWQKTYGGANSDIVESIHQTSDGGYIIGGSTDSFGAGDMDMWVLKLDSTGVVEWQKTYGGANWDGIPSIQQLSDSGYIVSGGTESFGLGEIDKSDIWILKLDVGGNIVWEKTYGGPNGERGNIEQTSDGGYIIGGNTASFGAGGLDVFVLKLDQNGNIRGCDLGEDSTASVSNTTVIGAGYSVVFTDTNSVVTITTVSPVDTSIQPNYECEPLCSYKYNVMPVPANYDGDESAGNGIADQAIYNFSNATWTIEQSSDGLWVEPFGRAELDMPFPGDYDGDGKADLAVFRQDDSTWHLYLSSKPEGNKSTYVVPDWSKYDDNMPEPGDYNGDGKTDIAVYRREDTTLDFLPDISDTSAWQTITLNWAGTVSGDAVPVPGDYDGDGITDFALYSPYWKRWLIQQSTDGFRDETFLWTGNSLVPPGWSTAPPVPADYDGDGKTDIAFYLPSWGKWYIKLSSNDQTRKVTFGGITDIPVPADYDGNGRDDIAFFRTTDETWHIFTPPDMNVMVMQEGIDIPSGTGSYDFGAVTLTTSKIVTFTIENNSVIEPLNLTLPIQINEVVPGDPNDFVVTQSPSTGVIQPGESGAVTFEITFTPATEGIQTATVSIVNSDPDENPYEFTITGGTTPVVEITTWYQLQDMQQNHGDYYYFLGNDLDDSTPGYTEMRTNTGGFNPIGDENTLFKGTFDGQGHTITGLFIDRPDDEYVGLFGYVTIGAEIKNVGLIDVDITGETHIGGLVGINNGGYITNSFVAGDTSTVDGTLFTGGGIPPTDGNPYTGGLVGLNQGQIIDCYAKVGVTGDWYVGGLVGGNTGSITNCYSRGDVNGLSTVGGLVGANDGGITNCYATGNVSSPNSTNTIGWLVGVSEMGGTITNSYCNDLPGTPDRCVGHVSIGAPTPDCTEIQDNEHYFKGDVYPSNEPMTSWDFPADWQEVVCDYPMLAWEDAPTRYTLTVTQQGAGAGTITRTPGGAGCATDDTTAYDSDTPVTLTAMADADSTFTGWSGGGCSGTGDCVVTMNSDKTITATFLGPFRSVTHSPANADNNAISNTLVSAFCTNPVDLSSANPHSFVLHGTQSKGLFTDAAYSLSDADQRLNLSHDASPFLPGELINATLTQSLQDQFGNTLERPYVWQFRTVVESGTGYFINSDQTLDNGEDLALGDLNGNGHLDAFIAMNGVNKVWWGDGNGSFTDSGQGLGSSYSRDVELGDLDNDGDLDAFVANALTEYSGQANKVWINNGSGSFTETQSLGAESSFVTRLGDMDGDGDLDAFVGNANNDTDRNAILWINNGNGTFSDRNIPCALCGYYFLAMEVGDFDNDGDLDAALGEGDDTPGLILLNDGMANFTCNPTLGSGRFSSDFSSGDVDNDGDLDIISTITQLPGPNLWLNDGTGQFTSNQHLNTESRALLGDLDGDGDLDIFSNMQILLNDRIGQFTENGQNLSASPIYALGDVDGDGDLDAVGNEVWLNRPSELQLTVNIEGDGSGTVTSDPAGISCGVDCEERYDEDTVVTLTATADASSIFTDWSGGGCSGTGDCVVTMDSYKTVTATFAPILEIYNWTDLQNMQNDLAGHYILMNDLDENTLGYDEMRANDDEKGFDPIGSPEDVETIFTGTFDGQRHTITGLFINRPEDYVGLFGFIQGATISNVGLVDVEVIGQNLVGGLVGHDSSTTGDSTITACYSTGNVSGSGDFVGGLIGGTYGTITASYSSANVSGSSNFVGGLIGAISGASIDNSYATGEVSGDSDIGGFIGANGGSITNSFSVGDVNGSGSNIGGLVGENIQEDDITASYYDFDNVTVTGQDNNIGELLYIDLISATYLSDQDWDFTNIWQEVVCGYPMLAWQDAFARYTLTVTQEGTGTGTITRTAAGNEYECVTDDTTAYDSGTAVTLTATADAGSVFAGWSGGGCSGTDDCVVTMDSDKTVTATFAPILEIHNWIDLQNMQSDPGGYYVLMNDLDETTSGYADYQSGAGFDPIGGSPGEGGIPFTGVFDGQGHTITGLFINQPLEDYVGLFGYVDGGQAQIRNVKFTSINVTGHNFVGGLAGMIVTDNDSGFARINNVDYVGLNNNVSIYGNYFVGGLVGASVQPESDYPTGMSYLVIDDCHTSGAVSGNKMVGGLVGGNYNTITNSSFHGNVYGGIQTGGLVGGAGDHLYPAGFNFFGASQILNSFASANIQSDTPVGGLVGQLGGNGDNSAVINCYSIGTVTQTLPGNGYYGAGGLIGAVSDGDIENSYSTSFVYGGGGENGGLVGALGYPSGPGHINNSFASGNLTGGGYSGGLVGNAHSGSISSSYYNNHAGNPNVCVSSDYGVPIDCTPVQDNEAYFQSSGNLPMSNWDFTPETGDWIIIAGHFPHLMWQDGGPIADFRASPLSGTAPLTVQFTDLSVGDVNDWYWDLEDDNDDGQNPSYTYAYPGTYTISLIVEGPLGRDTETKVAYITVLEDPLSELAGTGSINDPYQITSCQELQLMKFGLDKHFILTGSINCSETKFWNGGQGFDPIRDNTTLFTGTFDGQGYVINNLYIHRPEDDQIGLFGHSGSGAEIDNIGLIEVSIMGNQELGGLTGRNSGAITNSYVTGSILGYSGDTGGLVGYNTGTIAHSHAEVDLAGQGRPNNAGGLVGYNQGGTITNCYATGSISDNPEGVGGLVGTNDQGAISSSYATGDVSSYDLAGGLVGENNNATISNCYATGTVFGFDSVGGLVGANHNYGAVINSYSIGDVSVSGTGGLVGSNYDNPEITSSYYDSNNVIVTGGTNTIGALLYIHLISGAYLSDPNQGWDFTDIWRELAAHYPILQWQDIPINITSTGGPVTTPNGLASVVFPLGAAPEDLYVAIVELPDGTSPPANGGFQLLGKAYEYTAINSQGDPVTTFNSDVEITIHYDPGDLGGTLPEDLKINNYDDGLGQWIELTSTVNTGNNTVTAFTDHFTIFGIFGPDSNQAPSITIIEPDGIDDSADTTYTITWTDEDPDDDASIALYYDIDNSDEDGTLIVSGISEDDETDAYEWDTFLVPEGDYYVYAVIDDGVNPQVIDYSAGPVTISHCSPPVSGNWTVNESCTFDDIATAPADVIVEPDVVLTISDSAVLNIDFVNHKLLIQEDGGVLIIPGGKISQ